MASHRDALTAAALVGVGAAFDFHAGLKRQAPRWMQERGLEWAFRFATEPRRLGRRYLVNNPLFVWHVARQLLAKRRARAGAERIAVGVAPLLPYLLLLFSLALTARRLIDPKAYPLAFAGIWFAVVVGWAWLAVMSFSLRRL